MAVMRFVAYISWRRDRNGSDDFAVGVGTLIEVDHGQKIRGHPSLVSCPDVQHRFGIPGRMRIACVD
jgi:hypothetical protein